MPTEVILPRVDMDMTEGMIATWHVNEGDEVREGMLIFEIETSKATMEIDAPASGIIRQISAPVGKTVPVGTAVAWIYAAGEALCDRGEAGLTLPEGAATAEAEATQEEATQARAMEAYQLESLSDPHANATADAPANGQQPLRATPAARRLARERGLRLVDITGSGPHGRVAAQDVLRAVLPADGPGEARRDAPLARLYSITLRKGSGDPLVLLHGFAAESNSWRPFSQAVARMSGPEAGMLAVDLPAHGKSPAEAAGSLEQMVAALEDTLLEAGITRCHLVGHSFGGALALATTAKASRLKCARWRCLPQRVSVLRSTAHSCVASPRRPVARVSPHGSSSCLPIRRGWTKVSSPLPRSSWSAQKFASASRRWRTLSFRTARKCWI